MAGTCWNIRGVLGLQHLLLDECARCSQVREARKLLATWYGPGVKDDKCILIVWIPWLYIWMVNPFFLLFFFNIMTFCLRGAMGTLCIPMSYPIFCLFHDGWGILTSPADLFFGSSVQLERLTRFLGRWPRQRGSPCPQWLAIKMLAIPLAKCLEDSPGTKNM